MEEVQSEGPQSEKRRKVVVGGTSQRVKRGIVYASCSESETEEVPNKVRSI